MTRNALIALIVVVIAVAGLLYYNEKKDDVKIDLPGKNDITIDR